MTAPSEMRFNELAREPSLTSQVADAILDRIVSQSLRPGDALPSERELADQFNVSRTVVREAVRTLAGKGVVEVRSGRNIRVATVPASAVQESMSLFLRDGQVSREKLAEVRATLEIEIAGLAAQRATREQIVALEQAAQQMEAVQDDVDAAAVADVAFHRAIAVGTDNELYTILLDSIAGALIALRREVLAPPLTTRHGVSAIQAHAKILERISAHDPAGARAAMQEHLAEVDRMWQIAQREAANARTTADAER
jgi:GntR family transcriptional repressor for pyruvate dehydrogenase complex